MKKYIYCLALSLALLSCSKDEEVVAAPTEISNVAVSPTEGGALVSWTVPADSKYSYVEVKYMKNGKEVVEKASVFANSLLVKGLINKEPLNFTVSTVNEVPGKKAESSTVSTETVTPIKRVPAITYFPNDLTKLIVTDDMLATFTQEVTEGPKKNLVDGDVTTYWHSAWSSNTAPLPHWIQIKFAEVTKLGAIKYWFRGGGDVNARPSQWGLDVSTDGVVWNRVYTSNAGLPVADNTTEQKLVFDKNYESKFFRVLILKNNGNSYTHLGEITFLKQGDAFVDKEKEAEDIYYNY
jgi:hypothetical protein